MESRILYNKQVSKACLGFLSFSFTCRPRTSSSSRGNMGFRSSQAIVWPATLPHLLLRQILPGHQESPIVKPPSHRENPQITAGKPKWLRQTKQFIYFSVPVIRLLYDKYKQTNTWQIVFAAWSLVNVFQVGMLTNIFSDLRPMLDRAVGTSSNFVAMF